MIKAIIFDMDGLMFDTEALNAEGWKAAGKLHGFEMTDELLLSHIGLNVETTRRLMKDHFGSGFDYDVVRADRVAYSRLYIEENGMPLKHGLRELLDYLAQKGLKTAIGSSSDERVVRYYLEHASLDHNFDVIVSGDKVANGKPEPDIFLRAIADLGVSKDECLVLEDSYNGIRAAHRAGIRSVMVPDLLPPTPETEKLFFRRVDSLLDVVALIESLNDADTHSAADDDALLLFDETYPCWVESMAELAGYSAAALDSLAEKGLLAKEEDVYFLTPEGKERFKKAAAASFTPCRPGEPGPDIRREAGGSLLQMLIDKRHMQRWGLKEYCRPFRFEVPDLPEDQLFSLEGRTLTWKYRESEIFVKMEKAFPVTGLAARALPSPTPERLALWTEENIPKRRVMEADLLYKSRYDFQAYSAFPKLPCDPGGLLNADRFLCFLAPPPAPENERTLLTKLGEFHMFLTMMRRMYMPGYVDLDSLDQDGVNWIMFVYEREEDAAACAGLLGVHGPALAGYAFPLEVWSLSMEALQKRGGTAESIHDLFPETAHPIWRV